MTPVAFRATFINIVGNSALLILKLWAGLMSGSIALISEAINSLSDIISSISTFVCVRISEKQADEGHPFGHSRAEPVAGLVIAILAGILGFEIMKESITRFFYPHPPLVGLFALSVPVITILVKIFMTLYFRKTGKEIKSPALRATAMDSLMDIFVAAAALAGLMGVSMGYPLLDPIAGLVISLWIMYAGYHIGMENIDYLMGKAPEPALLREIESATLSADGVKGFNTVRAHYVGNFIHVEIHVEVDKTLSTLDSHAIGEEVEKRVESLESIQKTFVHLDPV
ncbi:MAG: cation diffusion facilitator family transporter [Thermodesulfobacteriota bacterium]